MRLLAIDPGETVGWAIYEDGRKVDGGQTDWGMFRFELAEAWRVVSLTDDTQGHVFRAAARSIFNGIDRIVIEDFLIYPEDVADGPPPPWDPVITARLIGAIAFAAELADVPVDYQGAKIKTSAEAAGAELDFARPLHENRHENDACRHAVYWFAQLAGNGLPEDGISFV